jgi:ABC-type Fe3+-siderophore transport system permease subunit
MNQLELPTHMLSDSDVERIKARIRRQRFTLFDVWQLRVWIMLVGAIVGVTGALWWFVTDLLRYNAAMTPKPLSLGSILGSAFQVVIAGSALGAVVGFMIWLAILGLFNFFRPVYVALFYSPEEFERQYAKKSPQIR